MAIDGHLDEFRTIHTHTMHGDKLLGPRSNYLPNYRPIDSVTAKYLRFSRFCYQPASHSSVTYDLVVSPLYSKGGRCRAL